MHDDVDLKAADHAAAPFAIDIDHTCRRFAGERPQGNAFPEQSICSPRRSAAAVPVTDAGAMTASRMGPTNILDAVPSSRGSPAVLQLCGTQPTRLEAGGGAHAVYSTRMQLAARSCYTENSA